MACISDSGIPETEHSRGSVENHMITSCSHMTTSCSHMTSALTSDEATHLGPDASVELINGRAVHTADVQLLLRRRRDKVSVG